MLKVENLSKSYRIPRIPEKRKIFFFKKRKTIVDKVSLEVKQGEIVAITGKSGCGKTTLFNVIAGLTRPSAFVFDQKLPKPSRSKVFFDGRRIFYFFDFIPSIVRNLRMGFIFQTFQLRNNESVRENILLPARLSGEMGIKLNQRLDKILDDLGILQYKFTKVATLSGGQKQRVAIARALINDPDLILGDEPTANLDSETSDEIFAVLTRLAKEKNKAILIITHKESMLKHADRVYKMTDGQMEEIQ